ncbi:MAG: type IV pilin-like G/H family protein [Leptolyngbyaceae bacterium]|nr:type IV pilin-like G/H family protein [Leptolyngbyaceae bacterium]
MNIKFARVLRTALTCQEHRISTQGLTLLELITSLVVVSILSAIALPSFLNFSLRSRHAEAQVNVGSMVRAQQSHYMWKNAFTTNLSELGLGISNSPFYQYTTVQFSGHQTLAGSPVDGVSSIAIPLTDVRGYMGKTWVDADSGGIPEVKTVMCEGDIGATYFMNNRTYCP